MTVKRLIETLSKQMEQDPTIGDLEVATCLSGDDGSQPQRTSGVGRACYWDDLETADGERRIVIVSQPIGWRFGRPDSPAALRAAAASASEVG